MSERNTLVMATFCYPKRLMREGSLIHTRYVSTCDQRQDVHSVRLDIKRHQEVLKKLQSLFRKTENLQNHLLTMN